MILVWYDPGIDGLWLSFRDDPLPARSLMASASGDTITIRIIQAVGDPLAVADYGGFGRRDGTGFGSVAETLAYLRGEFSRHDADTDGGPIVAAVAMPAGTPVAVSRATGQLVPARADSKAAAFVAGVLGQDVASGFAAIPSRGAVTLMDWTASAGTRALAVGQPYFLGSAGGMTSMANLTPGLCVARVGVAVSPTTLVVRPFDPVQL